MSRRPNVILILCDDMGFSDIGCFGAEIATPTLDRLAADGVRMSSFYNCARCCPTRASLMTGLYPHQAGVGHMVKDHGTRAYQGYLRDDTATIAEHLKAGGYRTWMSGKWHCGGEYAPHRPEQWHDAGDPRHPLPTQRGFDRYYGILHGAGSFFNPPTMYDEDRVLGWTEDEDFYLTDAISDRAVAYVDEAVATGEPFFGYVAYTAPHWPLHARERDIARYRGKYDEGWDAIRAHRDRRIRELGLLAKGWEVSPPDENSHPFDEAEDPEWEAERMAVYAAMIDSMDQGIGRIVEALERHGILDDTMIVFYSDNGGCAEYLREEGTPGKWPEIYATPTNRGTATVVGNRVGVPPGPPETFMSYDLPWANCSNVPFRKFKAWTHEGGISTPFVVSWKNGGVDGDAIRHGKGHNVDLAATILAACSAEPLRERDGEPVQPLEGKDLLPLWRGERDEVWGEEPIFWEHCGHSAVRAGRWKIVRAENDEPWQLHDMDADRTELVDLAGEHPDVVADLAARYDAWARRVEVRAWPLDS